MHDDTAEEIPTYPWGSLYAVHNATDVNVLWRFSVVVVRAEGKSATISGNVDLDDSAGGSGRNAHVESQHPNL